MVCILGLCAHRPTWQAWGVNYVTQVALPLSLMFIMFAMGLGLTRADFARVLLQPRDFFIGAALQVVVLPLVALALASTWPLSPKLAVGVMLLAACPGGTTSNLLTHLGRGDVALSITLTAVISVAGMLTIPIVLGGALATFIGVEAPPLPLFRTIVGIFIITTVPVGIGMFVRAWLPRFAEWAEPRSRPLVTIVFLVVVAAAVASERELLASNLDSTLLAVALLNVGMLALAYGVSRAFSLAPPQRTAITLECGLQNSTLAIVIAASMLNEMQYGVPAALYGLWMLLSAAVFAVWTGRQAFRPSARMKAASRA